MDSNSVLNIFREITLIPRESGHEAQMTAYLQKFAADRGLECKTDSTGNVLITRPATKGKENVPTIVLQSHQDMVCEKSASSSHDFATDPIRYEIRDGWMIAPETTLGADDGIGIAASLALLESDVPAGKIECLFTISEETGMDGAMALESGFFTGRTLINLDSEDEGQLFVGCAGGVTVNAVFAYTRAEAAPGEECLKIRLFNTLGGHSGDDIDKGRINTVQQMARFLYPRLEDFRLVSFNGGGKHNAIARETEAVVLVPAEKKAGFVRDFSDFGKALAAEYSVTDPDLMSEAADCTCPAAPVDDDVKRRLVASLVAVHHGVLAMSQDIPGLVETSSNLASVKTLDNGTIEVCTSQRSSVDSAKDFIADKVCACFGLAGAKTVKSDPYPGWKPNMDSHILKVCVESYRRFFGVEPEVKAIHAGLECGLFLEKFHDLDMISFGPTLRGVHAPGERLDLASNERFVRHLIDVVTNFE